jgi:ribose transport system substrate-binding protein
MEWRRRERPEGTLEESRDMSPTRKILVLACTVAMAAGCTTPAAPGSSAPSNPPSAAASGAVFDLEAKTPGPNGETPTDSTTIADLTDAEVQQIKDGNYDLTFLSSLAITWFQGVQDGVVSEAERLGMNTTIGPVSNFSAETQLSDVETVMATKPDILIALPNDPVSAAEAFRPVVDAGTTLVLYDNGINGYTAGKEYVGIVTGDHYTMAKEAAKLIGDALGGEGKLGFMPYDVTFFNTNNRDNAFRAAIQQWYPGIEIIEQGFSDAATTGEIADAMLTQHPDLDGIFASWSGGPTTSVLAALKAAGNTHVKVVSIDLDEANDLDMAMNGNYIGATAEETFTMGQLMVRAAAYKLLGKEFPPFVTVPTAVVTRDTLLESWKRVYHKDPPPAVLEGLTQ